MSDSFLDDWRGALRFVASKADGTRIGREACRKALLEIDSIAAERDEAVAKVERVRKHEAREASFRARQAIARWVAQELASSHDEYEAAEIRALIEKWEP